jgi:regulator of cell morphogenesis and NO signaling
MEETLQYPFQGDQKIGEIVSRFPKAADIFKDYRIDFCCGGDRLAKDALQEQGLKEEEVLHKINALYEEFQGKDGIDTDWTQVPSSQLIEHVLNTHHAYLHAEMPRISELTTKILRVHGAHHPELATVHRLFNQLKLELEEHLIKEEVIEFPLINEYLENPSLELKQKVIQVIDQLEGEHEGAGTILKELREVTSDYAVPDDGCNSYRLTYQKLEELENDMFQHVHLENNILFPRLKK